MSFARISALAKAEWLQFWRNKLLMYMAVLFPLGMPVFMFFVAGGRDNLTTVAGASHYETFLLMTMMLVQFYSVLSMITTRRDEGVLKRLRTGEALDAEILLAICIPGAVISLFSGALLIGVFLALGVPMPENILVIALATILGLVISSGLALWTSSFTRNAEAAQITSMPVMLLAMGSLSTFRPLFANAADGLILRIIDRTPFAAVFDVSFIGWSGSTYGEIVAESADAAGSAGVSLAIATLWAVAAVVIGVKSVKWDTYR
ncbi:ABC transporter permease [Corynebacterium sp. H113]|uniref:ABC transporter permease n=1 Tax=Corynebacterium sp. H113 TaxID=3133419 RepID=UPI00309A741F